MESPLTLVNSRNRILLTVNDEYADAHDLYSYTCPGSGGGISTKENLFVRAKYIMQDNKSAKAQGRWAEQLKEFINGGPSSTN